MQKVRAIFLSRVSKGPNMKRHKQNQSPKTQPKNTEPTELTAQRTGKLYIVLAKGEV